MANFQSDKLMHDEISNQKDSSNNLEQNLGQELDHKSHFANRLLQQQLSLTKTKIDTLQINLGKRCNLTCSHCHVEAGPKRTEDMGADVAQDLIAIIANFPQIKTVDLTGGAPEMHQMFRDLVEAASSYQKQIIVRSNLTIFWVDGYQDLPQYFADHQVRVVASLPCYLADNVDKMRGDGVFQQSIAALQKLNDLGYGTSPQLQLDLVYNPPLPNKLATDSPSAKFSLPPDQINLENAYKAHLSHNFKIQFNHLLTITNLPIGRTKMHLERLNLYADYLQFLSNNFNPNTVAGLMCRNQLSVDYLGNVYDCDFHQMAHIPARDQQGRTITIGMLLEMQNLDLISDIAMADFCYACTAGSGSSCGGAIV